jgi:hypothetical protein
MVSDFSAAWQCLSKTQREHLVFRYGSNSTPLCAILKKRCQPDLKWLQWQRRIFRVHS